MRVAFFLFCYVHVCAQLISLDNKNPFLTKQIALFETLYQQFATDTFLVGNNIFKEAGKVVNVINCQEGIAKVKMRLTWLNNISIGKSNKLKKHSTVEDRLKAMEQVAQKAKFKLRLSLFCMLVLIILTTLIGYFSLDKNRKVTERLMQLTVVKNSTVQELQQIKQSLKNKEAELFIVHQSLQERNYALQSIQQDLSKLQDKQQQEQHKTKLVELMKMLDQQGSVNGHGEQLRLQFELTYPCFFPTIHQINSKLTKSNLRLCTYIKLGMDTKKIAQMTNVSTEAVSKAKYRLKKKLQLNPEEQLGWFIKQL